MNYVQVGSSPPAAEIARDEVAFLEAERTGVEVLRIWEPASVAVVLGRGNREECEVFVEKCRADAVPILRRPSGGGAVVLMPGCLCYSLVFDQQRRPELYSAAATNRVVLRRLASRLSAATGRLFGVRGDSDLVAGDRKLAGHAQRRGRRAVLFHGCLLVNANLLLIETYLREPTRSPEYRGGRGHALFVENLACCGRSLPETLKECFLEW